MIRTQPEYQKVRAFVYALASNANDGTLKLPSEKELCEMFQVSRVTVRGAMDALVKGKVVVCRRGMGTFVHPEFSAMRDSERKQYCIGYIRYDGGLATDLLSGGGIAGIEKCGMQYETLSLPSEKSCNQFLELAKNLSGIVWDTFEETKYSAYSALANTIRDAGIPLLLLSDKPIEGFDCLIRSHAEEGALIAQCAKQYGHSRILFFSTLSEKEIPQNLIIPDAAYYSTYRELGGTISSEHIRSARDLESTLSSKDFLDRYTMIYTRRSLVRDVMGILKRHKIRVPEDISYLVFDESDSYFFDGKTPSTVQYKKSQENGIVQWLDSRIVRKERDRLFCKTVQHDLVEGETIRKIEPSEKMVFSPEKKQKSRKISNHLQKTLS